MHDGSKRWQVLLVGVGVAVGAGFTFALYSHVEGWLLRELPRRHGGPAFLSSTSLGVRLSVSIAAALMVALPELVSQGWQRLQPGASPSSGRLKNG